MSTYTLISSQVLGSSAASVTFSSIPQTYKDLVIRTSIRTDRSNAAVDQLKVNLNGDTSQKYSVTILYGNGASSSTSQFNTSYGNAYSYNPYVDGGLAASSTFSSSEFYIPNYTGSTYKQFYFNTAMEDNSSTAYIATVANLYSSTSAISSISIAPTFGPNFVTGSSFYLYGI